MFYCMAFLNAFSVVFGKKRTKRKKKQKNKTLKPSFTGSEKGPCEEG